MNETKKVFKVGDQVILNSGGPPMTIEKIDGNLIYCYWWVSAHYNKQNQTFKSQMLMDIKEC